MILAFGTNASSRPYVLLSRQPTAQPTLVDRRASSFSPRAWGWTVLTRRNAYIASVFSTRVGVARLKGDYVRDEAEQATYLRELVDIFNAAGVDSAFWTIFADYTLPHRDDPREDVDIASYGVVKVLEGRLGDTYLDMPWEPKAAFTALADYYRD